MNARSDNMSGSKMGMMDGAMKRSGMMPMMQRMHRMHQQMMNNPVQRSAMMALMLPAFADTLGLTDQQERRLQELKSEALAQRRDDRQQKMRNREELTGLFEEGNPSPEQVRRLVTVMAEQKAGRQAATYETAHQMRQVLTDPQRQMLQGLSHRERMRHVMATMPMMEMMQMMRSMHEGQMRPGMMQGGGMPMMESGMNDEDGGARHGDR